MAQHGAHVTQTLQLKPSIFEVVAADSLQATFYPAFKRIANYLACLKPDKFGWLIQYYDEIFGCLHGVLQQHYIWAHNGSLAEIFYGLARTHVSTNKLNRVDKLMAFLCVVIFPYLAAKLDSFRQKSKDEIENASPVEQKSGEMRRKKLAVQFITFARALGDSLQLVQFIAYMADVSRSHSLTNRIVRQQLNYLPPDTTVTWSWTDLFKGKFRGTALLSGVIFRSLELSAFFLQFLQWWQNETSFSTFLNLPTPEPPADALCSTKYRGICPICLQRWQIPTVNRISGFTFCYKCIVRHLDSTPVCPVTNYASSLDDLARIYDV